MRGRKPNLGNVVPMRPDDADVERLRKKAQRKLINTLRPKGLTPAVEAEFTRIAKILSDPTVDRLKGKFVDVAVEYAICCVRLREMRAAMPTLKHEVYTSQTRNGVQVKSHPYVGQINEEWRKWRSMVAMLGLSPADERNMIPGQGDLFDDAEKFFS